jgi:WXG100 family type VII secretion target
VSILHLQPEQLHTTGRQLDQTAEMLYWQAQRLDRSLQYLAANWQGTSRDQFVREMDERLSQLRRLTLEIAELAGRVQREADKWEQLDFANARAWLNIVHPLPLISPTLEFDSLKKG